MRGIVRKSEFQTLVARRLPELVTLERLIQSYRNISQPRVNIEIKTEATVQWKGHDFPIHSLVLGSSDKSAPCLAIFGGVHGLERIGSEVTLAWLQSLQELIQWDEELIERLQHSRLVFMPIVNPIGIFLTRRSNGNGVDLMRNAPVEADETTYPLLGGHRLSTLLPWYRGHSHDFATMEPEARALCELVEREVFPSQMAISVDVHSGFGSVDRLWFPYARTKSPPRNLVEMVALKRVFDRSYPNHFYRIEPQALQYTTHGDLWDWLYDRHLAQASGVPAPGLGVTGVAPGLVSTMTGPASVVAEPSAAPHEVAALTSVVPPGSVYLPWTLELGSWLWLKKNPRQLFSSLGAFNPLQPHRLRRILRRHITLFDFLHRAILSPAVWTKLSEADREALRKRAMDQWYDKIDR